MKEEGSIIAFNNFEPRTVTKLTDERNTRAHLICDIGVKSCLDGLCEADIDTAKSLILSCGLGTSLHYSPNHITHTISNFHFRNRLGMHYGGMHPNSSLEEQVQDEYILKTRE